MPQKKIAVIMKVCGIIGSPKKNGNVNLLVSQVLKGANSQGTETSRILFACAHDDNEVGSVKSNKEKISEAFDIGVRLAKTSF